MYRIEKAYLNFIGQFKWFLLRWTPWTIQQCTGLLFWQRPRQIGSRMPNSCWRKVRGVPNVCNFSKSLHKCFHYIVSGNFKILLLLICLKHNSCYTLRRSESGNSTTVNGVWEIHFATDGRRHTRQRRRGKASNREGGRRQEESNIFRSQNYIT